MRSDRLKQVFLSASKSMHMDLVLPSLTSLLTDIGDSGSLPNKKMVEAGCPLLNTWNGVNVKQVAKQAGSNTWAEHLVLPEFDNWD